MLVCACAVVAMRQVATNCNPAVQAVHDMIYPVAMPSFLLLAGLKDGGAGSSTFKLLQQTVTLLAIGSVFFYWAPDLSHRFWHLAQQIEFGRWRTDNPSSWLTATKIRGASVERRIGARLGGALIHVHTYQVGSRSPPNPRAFA